MKEEPYIKFRGQHQTLFQISEEAEIKIRAKRHGFRIVKTNWELELNPHYYIETIINDYETDDLDPLRYVFKVKLKYMK